MKKVLVTGSTGFVGRQSLPFLLERDYEVHAVSSVFPRITQSKVKWHRADLLDQKQIKELLIRVKPTHLLHFAWYAIPGKYWTSLENFRWVKASLSLLEYFAQQGGERAVMAGTCAEYDWNYGYCSEGITPMRPLTSYGICKSSLRSMLEAFATQTGISAAWGRIFFLYGPHEHPNRLVSSVVRSILRKEPAQCSHGNQVRDFLHVEDVASGFVALLESKIQGAVNIASGIPVVLKDVIRKIALKLDRVDLIQFGAIPVSPSESPLILADVRRLTDEVGWKPRFDMDSGLDQTIQWWINHLDQVES